MLGNVELFDYKVSSDWQTGADNRVQIKGVKHL